MVFHAGYGFHKLLLKLVQVTLTGTHVLVEVHLDLLEELGHIMRGLQLHVGLYNGGFELVVFKENVIDFSLIVLCDVADSTFEVF